MEFKILLSIFSSLLTGMFAEYAACHGEVPVRPKAVAAVEHRVQVPSFVTSVPAGHFAGVSAPCGSLGEARESAAGDVVRQILGAIDASYTHEYQDRVSGNPRSPARRVDDRLSKVAEGVVLGVEKAIVASSWSQDGSGRYVYFILVRYPDTTIAKMRRLSRGSSVVATLAGISGDALVLDVAETNGVAVTLSRAEITLRKVNTFAPFISYYILHVPAGSKAHYSKSIGPVRVCGGKRTVRLPMTRKERTVCDYILGSKVEAEAVLYGHDEIGRAVSAKVLF